MFLKSLIKGRREIPRKSAAIAVVIVLAVTIIAVRHSVVTASPNPPTRVDIPNLTLARPVAPARMTERKVLNVLKEKITPVVLSHTIREDYGAFDFSDMWLRSSSASTTRHTLGMRDVWKVTVTGLRLARPCARAPQCPPPVSTLNFFVDDKSGQVLESVGY